MEQRIAYVVEWFKRVYLDGVPYLIRDEAAFLSFVCMLAGIEALGGYREPHGSGSGANGRRFQAFLEDYFPSAYRPHAQKLWGFRNGMAHGFTPRHFDLTHHNSDCHFKLTRDGVLTLNAEDFYAAFLNASNGYFAALSVSSDLKAKFLIRLEGKRGGTFAVRTVGAE